MKEDVLDVVVVGYSYQKIEAKITISFCSRKINLSFNGLTYNTCKHFVLC